MPKDISRLARKFEREHTKRKPQSIKWLQHIDAQDMLEQLEIDNISQATADELVFSCPFPGHSHGDEKPSCYMNTGSKNPALTTVFKCHGCGRAGNAVSFVAEYRGITRQIATLDLKEHYAPGFRKPKYGSIQKEFEAGLRAKEESLQLEPELQELDPELYEQFQLPWNKIIAGHIRLPYIEYMIDRGFSYSDLSKWDFGYDRYSDRITLPICNDEANFVGVKARAYKEGRKPKYLNLGDSDKWPGRYGFEPYEKSLVVFGIAQWGQVDSFVFVEGEIDVISLWKMGIPAICTGGASMSNKQAQIIRQYCDEVVLFLDPDLAGSNAIWGVDKDDGEHKPGIIELLEPFIRVKLVGLHKFDANDYLRRNEQDKVIRLITKAKPSYQLRV